MKTAVSVGVLERGGGVLQERHVSKKLDPAQGGKE